MRHLTHVRLNQAYEGVTRGVALCRRLRICRKMLLSLLDLADDLLPVVFNYHRIDRARSIRDFFHHPRILGVELDQRGVKDVRDVLVLATKKMKHMVPQKLQHLISTADRAP